MVSLIEMSLFDGVFPVEANVAVLLLESAALSDSPDALASLELSSEAETVEAGSEAELDSTEAPETAEVPHAASVKARPALTTAVAKPLQRAVENDVLSICSPLLLRLRCSQCKPGALNEPETNAATFQTTASACVLRASRGTVRHSRSDLRD